MKLSDGFRTKCQEIYAGLVKARDENDIDVMADAVEEALLMLLEALLEALSEDKKR